MYKDRLVQYQGQIQFLQLETISFSFASFYLLWPPSRLKYHFFIFDYAPFDTFYDASRPSLHRKCVPCNNMQLSSIVAHGE